MIRLLAAWRKDLGQAHDRYRSRRDDIAENLPRAYRRQLIDVGGKLDRQRLAVELISPAPYKT